MNGKAESIESQSAVAETTEVVRLEEYARSVHNRQCSYAQMREITV